jgi:hypothetical protein
MRPCADALCAAAAPRRAVHWGYYSKLLEPKLTIQPGDTVTVEMCAAPAAGMRRGTAA